MEPLRDKSNNLCRYFLNGHCTRGSMCNFSHDLGTAASLPSSVSAPQASQVCRYFLRGFCSYGDQCRFAHPGGNPGSSSGGGPKPKSSGDHQAYSGVAPTPVPEMGGYHSGNGMAMGGMGSMGYQGEGDDKKKNFKKIKHEEGFAAGGARGGRGGRGRGGRGRGGALQHLTEMLAGGMGEGDFTYPRHPKLAQNMQKYASYLSSGEIGIDDLNSAMWHWSDSDNDEGGAVHELEMLMAMAMLGGNDDCDDPYDRNDDDDDDDAEYFGTDDDDDDEESFEHDGAFSGRASPTPIMTKKDAFNEDIEKEGISRQQKYSQPINFELPD